ncbi:MAG: translation initiation factor IF-2 subunit gamma [Nanoarchaeota archaeon]|nr:translation initiation factor IF-2 subunit gamma [Nanoarchaeota archaeon]MBU1005016.1 translation initiation factor IF-2 subunit gamma [Nanoarchaeota archaeon]MBU1945908.1 translation initiation factor IF-2 subunit gamma [Nanoarchaeota archaeon]
MPRKKAVKKGPKVPEDEKISESSGKKEKNAEISGKPKKDSESSRSSKKEEIGQPVLNIGTVGHVDHGKTTLLERLSGKWADTHSEEMKRGITIRLGYADVTLRKCEKCNVYTAAEKCSECNGETKAIRKISIVDAPGHESLMATMLAGATIMDGALLLIAANEECPQPQTREHLMALEIMGVENIVIVQNKIDLVTEEKAIKNYRQIKKFVSTSRYKDAPIIPISAQHNIGMSALIEAIEEVIKTPKRDLSKDPLMFVARSFDINKPGTDIGKIHGGTLGGALKQGVLKKGDEIEIKPGYEIEERNKKVWNALKTKIVGIKSGGLSIKEAVPGGSIGVMTSLDPAIVFSDKLTGSVVGLPGKLPPVWDLLNLEVHLLERVVGSKEDLNVDPIKPNEALMLNVNSAATVGIVFEMKKGLIKSKLKLPVCAEVGSRVTISRMIGNRFRLIGYGIIKD